MGRQMYAREDLNVFSWNGDNSILVKLGPGTITNDVTMAQSRPIKQFHTDSYPVSATTTIQFDLFAGVDEFDYFEEILAYHSGSSTPREFVMRWSDGRERVFDCFVKNVTETFDDTYSYSVTLEVTGPPK